MAGSGDHRGRGGKAFRLAGRERRVRDALRRAQRQIALCTPLRRPWPDIVTATPISAKAFSSDMTLSVR